MQTRFFFTLRLFLSGVTVLFVMLSQYVVTVVGHQISIFQPIFFAFMVILAGSFNSKAYILFQHHYGLRFLHYFSFSLYNNNRKW